VGLSNAEKRRIGRCRFEGQGHGEGRTDTGRAIDRDIAAHQLRQPADDREAEPSPPIASRRRAVRLRKRLEEARLLLGIEPDAGVFDRECHPRPPAADRRRACAHDDLAALGELDGIAQQVEQDLPDAGRIADQRIVRAGLDLGPDRQALGIRLWPQCVDGTRHQP